MDLGLFFRKLTKGGESMLTLELAKKMIAAAETKARELNIKVTVAIVDEHGILVAMHRMDGAFFISPKFATSKAHTAALLGLPSGALADYAGEGKPYFGINTGFGGELLPIAGGLPVKQGERVVGAIGVGGSLDVKQDVECAQEGLKATA